MTATATTTATDNPNYSVGQTWGALRKAWKGYKIAKKDSDKEKMAEYAKKIRKLQRELGKKPAEFPDLNLDDE